MESANSFFRLFDICFFVPGAVLLAGFLWFGIPVPVVMQSSALGISAASDTDSRVADGDAVDSAMRAIMMVGLAYVAGFVVHGIARFVFFAFDSTRNQPSKITEIASGNPSWFQHLGTSRLEDLALYFWYTRATAYNLAIVAIVRVGSAIWAGQLTQAVCLLASLWLFIGIGREYHRSLQRCHATLKTRTQTQQQGS